MGEVAVNNRRVHFVMEAVGDPTLPVNFICQEEGCGQHLAFNLGGHARMHGAGGYTMDLIPGKDEETTDAIFADGTTLPQYLEEVGRLVIGQYKNSRERSIVLTKLEEAGLWMTKCEPAEKVVASEVPYLANDSELGIHFNLVETLHATTGVKARYQCTTCLDTIDITPEDNVVRVGRNIPRQIVEHLEKHNATRFTYTDYEVDRIRR
jgi:hypothetical protein